jgi:hypothetical protein
MKNRGSIYFVVGILALLWAGCENDDTTYYASLGVIRITEDSTIIESDAGNRLWVHNPSSVNSDIVDGTRVLADFSLIETPLPQGIDYAIQLISIEKVLFKPVIELTEQNSDSIGNDPLQVSNLWLVRDFLNLSFNYLGGGTLHYINLVRPEGPLPQDTVPIEIRHNDRNDSETYLYNALVTFDLTSLQNDVADSVILHIRAKEFENRYYNAYFTYKY